MTDILERRWGGAFLDFEGSGFDNLRHPNHGLAFDGVTNDRPGWVGLDASKAYDVPPGTSLISTSATITAKALRFGGGALIKPASGAVITINADIIAGLHQIFDLSAGGTVLLTGVREVFPQWWGATGLGVINDSPALQNTFDAAAASSVTAFVGTAARPAVNLGKFKYRISTAVATGPYATIVADRAALMPDAGVAAFTTTAYQVRIRGVLFIGGAKAVTIASNNVDTSTLHFDECEFQDQTDSCIESDLDSASTVVTVDRSRFVVPDAGATVFKGQCLDQVTITRSWLTVGGVAFQVGSATKMCRMTVEDCVCVPTGGSTIWVKNYGHFTTRETYYGGEAAALFCENRGAIDPDMSDPKGLIVENCQIETVGMPYVRFYEVPNEFVWKGVRSGAGAFGFSFETGISLANFRSYVATWRVEGMVATNLMLEGIAEAAARAFSLNMSVIDEAESLLVAAKLLQINNDGSAQLGVSQTQANYTQPAFTHPFGASVRGWAGDSATYNGSASEDWTTALNGFSTGWYTAVFDIEVTGTMPVAVRLFGSDRDSVHNLAPGKHLVNVPFYYNAVGGDQSVGYELIRLNDAKVIGIGPVRVFAGQVRIRTQNNVLYAVAAAAPTTLRWELGDRVINSTPTVGQPKARVCTAPGVPGTWVSEGNL